MNDEQNETPTEVQPHPFLKCDHLTLFWDGDCKRCGYANCHRFESDDIHKVPTEVKVPEVAAA